MKKLLFISAVGIVLAGAALAHEGHEHATGVVRERMILMEDMGKRLLAISKRLRANKDLDRITLDARAIHEMAGRITAQFPPGSTQSPTAAKSAVWQEWPDFSEKAKALEAQAKKFAEMTTADGKALRDQFRAVGLACDRCHESYRVPKGNDH